MFGQEGTKTRVCVCVRPVVEIGGSRNALVTNEELVERKHERVSNLRRGRLVSSTGGDFFCVGRLQVKKKRGDYALELLVNTLSS